MTLLHELDYPKEIYYKETCKGLYYRYDWRNNQWRITDDPSEMGTLGIFPASQKRLDQYIDIMINELNK